MRVFLWPREKSERKTLNIEVWIQISFYQQSVNKSWNSPRARHFTDSIPVAQWHISMSVMFQIFETAPCNNKDRNHCLGVIWDSRINVSITWLKLQECSDDTPAVTLLGHATTCLNFFFLADYTFIHQLEVVCFVCLFFVIWSRQVWFIYEIDKHQCKEWK